jgi:folate-binding protein YgfZ
MSHPSLSLSAASLRRLRHDAVVVRADLSLFRIAGPKALDCLQGLLTNDLTKPGEDSLTYGALLTSKGMVVVDAWVVRHRGEFLWLAPGSRAAATLDIFRRSLPPRMAVAADESASRAVLAIYGARAHDLVNEAGLGPRPEPGRCVERELGGTPVLIARPLSAPFALLLIVAADGSEALVQQLIRTGAGVGDANDAEAARILAGWPGLGREIDDKTLPQEVRYDEINGVSYSKGCYVGQETVARLHFRGHANRELRGLIWQGSVPADDSVIRPDGKPAGEVSSLLRLPDRTLGLVKIRRELLELGATEVAAGGVTARLVPLPFEAPDIA